MSSRMLRTARRRRQATAPRRNTSTLSRRTHRQKTALRARNARRRMHSSRTMMDEKKGAPKAAAKNASDIPDGALVFEINGKKRVVFDDAKRAEFDGMKAQLQKKNASTTYVKNATVNGVPLPAGVLNEQSLIVAQENGLLPETLSADDFDFGAVETKKRDWFHMADNFYDETGRCYEPDTEYRRPFQAPRMLCDFNEKDNTLHMSGYLWEYVRKDQTQVAVHPPVDVDAVEEPLVTDALEAGNQPLGFGNPEAKKIGPMWEQMLIKRTATDEEFNAISDAILHTFIHPVRDFAPKATFGREWFTGNQHPIVLWSRPGGTPAEKFDYLLQWDFLIGAHDTINEISKKVGKIKFAKEHSRLPEWVAANPELIDLPFVTADNKPFYLQLEGPGRPDNEDFWQMYELRETMEAAKDEGATEEDLRQLRPGQESPCHLERISMWDISTVHQEYEAYKSASPQPSLSSLTPELQSYIQMREQLDASNAKDAKLIPWVNWEAQVPTKLPIGRMLSNFNSFHRAYAHAMLKIDSQGKENYRPYEIPATTGHVLSKRGIHGWGPNLQLNLDYHPTFEMDEESMAKRHRFMGRFVGTMSLIMVAVTVFAAEWGHHKAGIPRWYKSIF